MKIAEVGFLQKLKWENAVLGKRRLFINASIFQVDYYPYTPSTFYYTIFIFDICTLIRDSQVQTISEECYTRIETS